MAKATQVKNDDWTGLVDGANSEKLCGFDDWRVPTINELSSIAHKGKTNPAIDEGYFPNTSNSDFWSASPVANNFSASWVLNFTYSYDYDRNRTNSHRVRLTRLRE